MTTKSKIEKAAAIASHAASLADCVDAIVCESIQMVSSDAERNRGSQLIFAAGALTQQVGWLCDLVAETLGEELMVTKEDAKDWMLPPNCKD